MEGEAEGEIAAAEEVEVAAGEVEVVAGAVKAAVGEAEVAAEALGEERASPAGEAEAEEGLVSMEEEEELGDSSRLPSGGWSAAIGGEGRREVRAAALPASTKEGSGALSWLRSARES